jgi:hypothetical protein
MAKETRITFSKEHTSKSNPQPHTDTYRQSSDQSRGEKIGHNVSDPGYGEKAVNIPVKQSGGESKKK